MAGGITFKVSIQGANKVLRAFGKLPKDANNELRDEAFDIAKVLADRIKVAGRAFSKQAARVAATVREVRDRFPVIQASNTGRAKGFLFASDFGMNRKTGWYRKPRYFDSDGYQFQPWNGGAGKDDYWFFVTAEKLQPYVEDEWRKVADAVVRKWSA